MDAKDLRARVQLDGPLPAGTTEFGCVPTFHEAVGIRLRGTSLELWRREEVLEVTLSEADAARFAQRVDAYLAGPDPETDAGRDGLVLLVRSHLTAREFEYFTTGGPSPWLELARDLLSLGRGPRSRTASDTSDDRVIGR